MKRIYELQGAGQSIRSIAGTLGISRNTVRKYVRSPEVPQPKPRAPRSSLLDAHKPYIHERLAEGVSNCVVLLRELRAQGYQGQYSILKEYVKPFRRRKQPVATMSFETEPGAQAQVDFGSFTYVTPQGTTRRVWGFVMVLSWSRAMYLEFVQRADLPAFIRCHLNAFRYLGGVPERCLYDNTKLVVLGREAGDAPIWNLRFLDFAQRLGFESQLCRPYRAQTQGRVERAIRYARDNFWPSARFTDLAELNRQAEMWCSTAANARLHSSLHERPGERLAQEQAYLRALPGEERLTALRREERTVDRNGYVRWDSSYYGVPWPLATEKVQVQVNGDLVEIWSGDERVTIHPRAQRAGQKLKHPRQWDGLPLGDGQPARRALAKQVTEPEVQQRSLAVYAAVAGGVA